MVLRAGIEPARPEGHRILSLNKLFSLVQLGLVLLILFSVLYILVYSSFVEFC